MDIEYSFLDVGDFKEGEIDAAKCSHCSCQVLANNGYIAFIDLTEPDQLLQCILVGLAE